MPSETRVFVSTHRKLAIRVTSTFAGIFALLAVPMLVTPRNGSQTGGAILSLLAAISATGGLRARAARVAISAERITVVNMFSTKEFARDQVQRFKAGLGHRTEQPVAALELKTGKLVALDATRAYNTNHGRATVEDRVAEMNQLIGAPQPAS